jgi:hypothetical protein
MPTASALFRSGELAPAPRTFTRWWSPDGLLRDLAEASSLWIDAQVSWRSALDNRLRTSFAPAPPRGGDAPPAGPGPIRWWPEEGRYVVDTPRYQAIVGRSATPVLDRSQGSPNPGSLRGVASAHAVFSLASLDGGTLGGTARRALLTLAGRTERDGTLRSTGGPGTLVYGEGPAWMERVVGFVDVRWEGRPEAWALGPTGEPVARVPVTRAGGGWWRIATAELETPWIELRSR